MLRQSDRVVTDLNHLPVQSSSICSTSPLRISLGPQLVRTIQIDLDLMDVPTLTRLFPPTVWSLPDRRVTLPLRVTHVKMHCSDFRGGTLAGFRFGIEGALHPTVQRWVVHRQSPNEVDREGTVDVEVAWTEHGRPRVRVSFVGHDLQSSRPIIRGYLVSGDPILRPLTLFRMTIDLSRVVCNSLLFAIKADIQALVTACLDNRDLWDLRPNCSVEFQVASDNVAQIVEETIAASIWHSRKKRCSVMKF